MMNAILTISIPLAMSDGFSPEGRNVGEGASQNSGYLQSPNSLNKSIDQIAGMLADALSEVLFQKKGDGATFSGADNPLMKMAADFMDQHRSNFSGPDDATGHVRSWNDELQEDNYLDKHELSEFKQGLKGALANILGGIGNAVSSLGSVAGGIAGGVVGGFGGSMIGSAVGGAVGSSVGGALSGLGEQIGSSTRGGFGSAGFGSAGLAGDNSGFNLRNLSPMGQSGFAMGDSFAVHVGQTAIDGLDIKEHHHGHFSFGREDKDLAKDIGKFMDQHTDVYGPQPRGGWASRIEHRKDFNSEEIGRFKQAMSDVKGIMNGQSTGNKQVDMDATLLSNAILSDSLSKVAA